MQPLKPPAKPAAPKPTKPERPPHTAGIESGDHVYIKHPTRGPIAARVVATGAHGLTADCDQGKRHRRPWSDVLGAKARLVQDYRVVDQGADGSILEDRRGKRRFVAGALPADLAPNPEAPEPIEKPAADDPLTGGLARLKKSETSPVLILLKAGQRVANRPGLALRDVTDRLGHQTKRWERTSEDAPKPRQASATPVRHGETVGFQHGDVRGSGKIVGSGRDGVTVQDEAGREHQVRHEHLLHPAKPAYAERKEGETDKAYAKRAVDTTDAPDHLPEEHGRYFNLDAGKHEVVPLDKIDSSKSDEENQQGGDNSPKRMLAAYHGALGKRDPISVKKVGDRYTVTDGNGTFTGAKKHGWKSLPVQVQQDEGEGQTDPTAPDYLFSDDAVKALPKKVDQPAKTQEELFRMGAEGLDQLKTWLDKGKGVSSRLGHRLMTKGPDEVTPEEWQQPGGMLFIAPLKGEKRAKEKVEGEYGGDWGQLRDVVRCSIAVDGMAEMKDLLKRFDESGMKLPMQPKDRFNRIKLGSGYRDVLMNVKLPNGMLAEVQLHLKGILLAKIAGHKHYEETRTIELKPADQWTPEERTKHADATAAMKKLYDDAFTKATGAKDGEPMTKSLASSAEKWEHFERDGALFKRPAGPGGVTHVWRGGAWAAWTGDRTAPHVYGNPVPESEIGDWTGGGGEKPMRKAVPLLLFKAQIRGGAVGDLFAEQVDVRGHMRGGRFIAPHQATRQKKHEEPKPLPPGEADRIAEQAFAWHAKAPKGGPLRSFAGILGSWGHATRTPIPDHHESEILAAMNAQAKRAAAGIARPKPTQADGLAPHTPQTPAPPATVPENVKANLGIALRHLRAKHDDLTEARKRDGFLAGEGVHHEAEWRAEHMPGLQGRLNGVAQFRGLAAGKGIDPEAVIAELGGFPDFSATGPIAPQPPKMPAHLRPLTEEEMRPRGAPVLLPKPAAPVAEPEPGHITEMRQKLARYEGSRSLTASDEKARDLYRQRLAASHSKWKAGQGVTYSVASGGAKPQWNRGFQITEVSPRDLMARVRQVADTGLTSTGGDGDRFGDEWIYLGDLKRDKKYDRAA